MAVQALESDFPNDRLPLLRWLMFTGVCAFGFVLVWYFGLFRLMLASDKTYISLIIVALYLATCVHCFLRTMVISRELDAAHRVAALVSGGVSGFNVAGQNVVTSEGARLPPGQPARGPPTRRRPARPTRAACSARSSSTSRSPLAC